MSLGHGVGLGVVGCPSGSTDYSPLTKSLYTTSGAGKGGHWPSSFGEHPPTDFESNQPFSAFVWCKLPLVTGGNGYLLNKYDRFNVPYRGWYMQTLNNGGAQNLFAGFLASNGSGFSRRVDIDLKDGLWHLLGFTYNGANNVTGLSCYLDGVNPGSATSGSSVTATIKNDICLACGRAYENTLVNIVAYYCHSAVYNVCLTPAQVLAIYGSGVPQNLLAVGPSANLVHWCTIGDNCTIGADQLPDLSASNLDGQTSAGVVVGDFVADVPA